VPRRTLRQMRNAIRTSEYDLTRHAVDEMAEDELGIFDVEAAVLTGKITKTEMDDVRGVRYTVIGLGNNQRTEVGVVGRFTEANIYLIITVYKVSD